ncbi:MAG TPA: hypothetical protein VGO53_07665, partial [Steroidobacteraceae bacterium]|nr:hypothetical protein [Steroidobacteraceae bacterium]
MNASFKNPILCALCAPLILASSSLLGRDTSPSPAVTGQTMQHRPPWKRDPAPLVDKVRRATERFRDINVALAEGWVQGTPCVSGPNSGAMGVHFIQPARIGDGVLNADEPEALIYEPLPGGSVRLVGIEFITLASAWESHNPGAGAPALEGHLLNYVGEPN